MSGSRALARLTVAPTLLLTTWLLAGLPLLLAGVFRPLPAAMLALPIAAVVLPLGLRRVPERAEGPWWSLAALLAVVVGFAALEIATHTEQIIVRRDPASYVQFATWIAEHGSLPVPEDRAAFGGGDPALSYQSLAFYQRGGVVVPQFMAGTPMTLAIAHWVGGTGFVVLVPALLGALAVLVFGGLTARLVGARWAPVGALALAVTLPEQFVSRSAYSEPAAQILLLGGLCLLLDAFDVEEAPARLRAGLAGVALGLSVLDRIDGLSDVLPVIGYAGYLALRRRPETLPLAGGLAVGVGYGLVDGFVLSRPYLNDISNSFRPLLLISGAVLVGTALVVAVLWRRGLPCLRPTRIPDAAAVLPVIVMIGFAVRPYVQTVRGPDDNLTARFIGDVQALQHLPIDPGRQYYEISLYWIAWYVGVPAILLATFAAALLTRRVLAGRAARWVLPLAMISWATVTTLYRPAITPDHPWASRRLVPLVVPGLLLLAIWALAWGVRRLRGLGYGPVAARTTAICGVAVICAPAMLTAAGILLPRTEQGEIAAVHGMCRAIGPQASVVIVERVIGDRFTQLVRGMCGVPAARMDAPTPQAVARVVRKIRAAGRRPVLLGANASDLRPYGGRSQQVMRLRTRQDTHTLVAPPTGTWGLGIDVWMSRPPG